MGRKDNETQGADSAADADAHADTDADADAGHYFPDGTPSTEDVTKAEVDPDSKAIIGFLESHGWGNCDICQIDFSIEVLQADTATERRKFTPTKDFYSPDCD